ncbi:DBH-like monooxygenase protein 1 [Trichonephila inaurata madagascariensis]|uniref:DBH-like monooxygenase protein 1 n=1 Tax=Trichonephila inaurata madagascariensis TaxID=2747483 RepID=A0A8X6WVF8_9ARAC|nr:DBH-like monooxygenase protein 1 [Trichonephila inaurata madagascariensis]
MTLTLVSGLPPEVDTCDIDADKKSDVEPLIQKGNEAFVHHLLMYECVGGDPSEYDEYIDFYGHQCHHTNMPDAMKRCEGVFLAWGVGGEDLVLPEYVGLPLVPSPTKYYMMEIHYDNPHLIEGIVDNSGFRIYYTPKLRKYDAGTLMIGSTVTSRVIVPPKQEKFIVTGHSNPKCLDPVLPKDGIKFLGVLLHSHLLGRGLKARHFRKSEELPSLLDDTNYDFNYQEYRYYTEEVPFLPGDQITVECTYDSSKRVTTTFGGQSTREEMCLAFILYYPLVERFASVSVPQLDVINKALRTNFTKSDLFNGNFRGEMRHYDWTTVDINEVQKSLRYGLHDTHCYLGNGVKNSIKAPISYPKLIQEYKEVSSCISKEFQNGGQRNDFSFLSYLCILIAVYTSTIIKN